MTLTAAQILQAKKHTGVWPNDTLIDASIAGLSDGAAKEAELVAAIALCETRYAAINTAFVASDELVAGGGASFSYERYTNLRKQWYQDAVRDLRRLLGMSDDEANLSTGWRVC